LKWRSLQRFAQAAPGFPKDEAVTTVPAGFGHKAVISLAGPILESIKTGDIKRFYVIGGSVTVHHNVPCTIGNMSHNDAREIILAAVTTDKAA
jgi:hydroxylamine reductase (hybrid-cluster protein)